jgi:hypothetical protein
MELWELIARERCRDTLAQYSHAGDRFRLEEFAAAFCEDGVLQIRDAEPLTGRAAIIERFMGGARPTGNEVPTAGHGADGATQESESPAPPSKTIVRHSVTNVRFEAMSPSEATVASYFTVFTEVGLDHMGRYRDRMVPVGDLWLIAHRFVSTDWRAPDSVFRQT